MNIPLSTVGGKVTPEVTLLPAEADTTDPRSVWRCRTVVSTFLIRLHSTAPRVGLRVWSILRKRQPVLAVSASHLVQPICRCLGCPSFADRLSSECRLTLCDSVVSLCLRLKLRSCATTRFKAGIKILHIGIKKIRR